MASVLISLKGIFEELCKGNISIIDINTRIFLSEISMILYNSNIDTDKEKEDLKYLILICNVLYNRSDMLTLPVEDGVYDILLEKYKTIDPNFQVGSVVVQFQSMIEKELISQGKSIAVKPIKFLNENKDEIRQHFENEITRFYKKDLYNSTELSTIPIEYNPDYINKRTHDTSHNHPQLVGTLDKCKFVLDSDAIEKDVYDDERVKILERDWFRKHIDMGIISENEEIELILELKYDGVSVEADCTDIVVSARTRGDTGIGQAADITPILYGYQFPRNTVLKHREVGVKFEGIMTKTNLARFNIDRGNNYANCRTAIIGLFGASDAYKYRDYITLIPLALDRDNVPEICTRAEEIELLNKLYRSKGQCLNHCYIKGNYQVCLYLIKKYMEECLATREYLDFMFDCIVISYADERIREKLGRENFINKYQMAVKFEPLSKTTTFLGYTFEVGQNGTICPMIHYTPVEFLGTIHPKSTGSSYKRFKDLGLKIGDLIQVTYENDVMPYVTSIDCEHNRQNPQPLCEFPNICPVCRTILKIGDKTAICPNVNCDGRKIARMVNMLQKLNLKGFADSRLSALNVYTLHELFKLSIDQMKIIGDKNALLFRQSMDQLMSTPTEDYRLMGSIGFTNIGSKKWKLIFSEYTLLEFKNSMEFEKPHLFTKLCSIKGIGETTARIILEEYQYFEKDIDMFLDEFNIIDSKNNKISGKQIRFTGCRDKILEEKLKSMGHDADGSSSVTKQTDILLIPYEGFSSSKLNKVSDNTIIVTLSDFVQDMSKYL